MIRSFFTHTVNVLRQSDVLFTAQALPISTTLNTAYTAQDVVVMFTIPSGTAVFEVTGQLNSAAVTSTVTIAAAPLARQTTHHFDYITAISTTSGTAATASAVLRTRLGQPVYSNSILYADLEVRLDRLSGGDVDVTDAGVIPYDRIVCFTTTPQNAILPQDQVVDTVTAEEYEVKDINTYFEQRMYHHTELTLNKTK